MGPSIIHALRYDKNSAPAKLTPDQQMEIQKLMDLQVDEGFFSHGSKAFMTANFYVKIPSEIARGKQEIFCLSVITRSKKPEMFKDTLALGAARIKAIPDIYIVFHHADLVSNEELEKKQQALKEVLASLCQDLLHAKKQAIAKDSILARLRNQTRDRNRDQSRDNVRDEARDLERDQARDHDRDQARDCERDQTRDNEHDQTRPDKRHRPLVLHRP